MAMALLAHPETKLRELRKEIREALLQEMQGAQQDGGMQFLTYQQLEDIWTRQAPQRGSYFDRFAKILRLRDPTKSQILQNQLKIISILFWIRFDQWMQYFMKEAVPAEKNRIDSRLPLEEHELEQIVFDFSRDFFHEQFRFLPITIH